MAQEKFLILYAPFGAGHRRAAEALREGLLTVKPRARVDVLDYYRFINSTVNNLVHKTYMQSLRLTPGLWGKFYHRTSGISGRSRLSMMLNKLGRDNFINYLRLTSPDSVITTYPVPAAGVLSDLKGRGLFTGPVVTVITDFGIHNQWVHPNTDLYLVGTPSMKEKLRSQGIPEDKIFVSGIPVSPVFTENPGKTALCRNLNLNPAVPTVLLMGGACGILEGMKYLCSRLAETPEPLQLLVVCGQDTRLYDKLQEFTNKARNRVLIFPFIDKIHELMTIADLVVTKAGGLTTAEALTKRLPMVIFRPLPGQEEENARYLQTAGAALVLNKDAGEVVDAVLSLINNRSLLQKMSTAAKDISPRDSAILAAMRICRLTLPEMSSDFA